LSLETGITGRCVQGYEELRRRYDGRKARAMAASLDNALVTLNNGRINADTAHANNQNDIHYNSIKQKYLKQILQTYNNITK
jgi:hypothetical protein